MDICFSLSILLVMSPVLLVLTCLIRLKLGRPVLFKQERPGYQGKPFFIYKFRTMTNQKDKNGQLLPDEQRLTRFGQFLRKTSLDEFPEFVNVLIGDMSIIGPRPLLMNYLPLYSPEQMRRHEVRPGVTGWAQVNGRNAISWEEKFKFDVWYVDHVSFWVDLKIFFLTIFKVFKKEGISAEGSATMPTFTGSATQSCFDPTNRS